MNNLKKKHDKKPTFNLQPNLLQEESLTLE